MPANLEWAKPGNAGKKSSAEMGQKMKLSEIGRLVWLNLVQNKFKVFLTSTGIIVGSATIMLVIAIGTGGKLEVAEQFKNLNAGSVDISYEYNGSSFMGEIPGKGMSGGGMSGGRMPGGGMSGGGVPGGDMAGSSMPGGWAGGGMPGGMGGGFSLFDSMENQMNMTEITLSKEDADNLKEGIPEIASATISYTTRQEVEGGGLDESASYTVASVKENYADISNLEMAIGTYDILQNIIMPLVVRGMTTKEAEEKCFPVIEMLGIGHRLRHKPSELSGGQKQRVSIARALVGEPALLLADEPTGALDSASGKDVLALFGQLHKMGNTIVMITHDLNVAKAAGRIVHIVDGCLE